MSYRTTPIYAAGHGLKKNPSWPSLVILSKTLINGIELPPLPRKLLTIVQALNRFVFNQIGNARERRKFPRVLS